MSDLTGSSALRLCVWLFDDGNFLLLDRNKCFLLTFWTVQRKIHQNSIITHPGMGFISASRT